YQQEHERIKSDFENGNRSMDQEYKVAIKEAIEMRDQRPRQLDEKAHRIAQRNERFQKAKLEQLSQIQPLALGRLREGGEVQSKQLAEAHAAKVAQIEGAQQAQWEALEKEWQASVTPICQTIQNINTTAEEQFPEWQLQRWEKWTAPEEHRNAAKVGRLE